MRRLVSALSVAAVLIAVMAVPASAAAPRVAGAIPASHHGHGAVVAKITGAGTALMQLPLHGTTLWWENAGGITLYSDGFAKGTFFCEDLPDSGIEGTIWGAVTSWNMDGGFINLYVPSSTFIPYPNGKPVDAGVQWRIQIQKFGGPGVGHWTLDFLINDVWVPTCLEQVTGGAIVLRQRDWKEEGTAGTD